MKKFWFISMVYLLLSACNDPYENTTYLVYDSSPAAAYMNAHPETFSEWVNILQYTNMYNALNQANSMYTCFAPNNEAVKAFFTKKGVGSIQELGDEYALDLVKFHVIYGSLSPDRFTEGAIVYTTNASGDRLTINFGTGGANAIYVNGEARVQEVADTMTNGYVYVLDAMLTPLVETLYDRVEQNNDRYSIFKEAIETTGWSKRLDTPYDTTYTNYGSMVLTKKNFTLLAVPNDVFQEQGIATLEQLKQHLHVSNTNYTSKENELWRYVSYHLLSGTYYKDDLYKLDGNDTVRLMGTNDINSALTITLTGGKYYLNYEAGKVSLQEGQTNILAKNGTIHEVDGLLEVCSPEPTTVNWDFCDQPDIAAVVGSILYQQLPAAEQKVGFSPTRVTSYSWIANSTATPVATWPPLGYATEKGSGGVGNYGALNYDMLSVNLGYLGSFSTHTPVLIKGKYKVEIYYAYGISLKDFRTNGSKCQVSFDGTPKEIMIYKGIENKQGIYSLVIYNMLEFETTTAHDFKLVLMDALASTDKSYRLQLDYIKFSPIK